jgi:hypothetical protein
MVSPFARAVDLLHSRQHSGDGCVDTIHILLGELFGDGSASWCQTKVIVTVYVRYCSLDQSLMTSMELSKTFQQLGTCAHIHSIHNTAI